MMYTVRHRHTGAPRLPLDLRLDPQRVSAHGLLDAKALMDANAARVERSIAPPETKPYLDETLVPGYMAPTENRARRDAAEAERIAALVGPYPRRELFSEEEWAQKMRTSQARIAWLAKQMTPSQRDEEERVLRRMRDRQNFAPNPRHPRGGAPPRVARGATARTTTNPAMTASTQPERYDEIFVVEPPNVEFNAYEIGETYELKLTIRNKSALSRRLRVLPPASRYFSVTEMRWPSQHGMLAPGMSCSCSVRFKPESLADYEDSLTVLSEVMKFKLDLAARRHPPKLTLDAVLDVGHVLVGNDVEFRLPFKNVGGQGRFRVVDDEDWPERATPLALPNLDAALEPGETPEDVPTPCVHLEPFRVGPGVMDLAPMQWEKLRVGFAPPGPGEFTREFRLVCDNCQVRTFAVRGRGAVLDVAVTRVDDRDAVPGEFANHAVWFGDDVEPGCVKTRRFTVRNATPVPLPFEWEQPSEEGVFVVAPAAGTLAPDAETEFVASFSPLAVASYERRFALLVDCAFPPREPLNGAAMFERPVEVESVLVSGAGRARDVVVDVNLVNFAGALLPGRHYDREIRLTNRGDAACAFAWRGQDNPRETTEAETRGTESVLLYPPSGTIAPGESVACVVELTADDVSRCDRTLACVCEHGPELFVRVTAEVEGPEVVFAQSSLDFGLLQRGVPGDAYLVLRNASPVPAAWTLEERRDAAAADATTRFRNPRGEIRFSVSRGVLPPHAEVEVECTLTPSEEGAYRGVVACVAGGGRVAVVDARADVLRPRCALSVTETNLGVCYVGVPVEREVVVQNMTMLPAVFRWAPEPEGESGEATDALDFECDWREDEVPPGGSRAVRFRFTPFKPCRSYSAIVVCDVDGAAKPLGFAVECEIRGLRVEYDVFRGVGPGAPLVCGDGFAAKSKSSASRSAAAVDPSRDDRPVIGDAVRLDFGDDCEVREHATMELVIRNVTAMEVPVWISAERLGVPDDVAARTMEAWAEARSADGAGLAGGGVSGAGARAVGGLPGGDGILAAALRSTTVMRPETFGAEVFGAASTAGPALVRASMRRHANPTDAPRQRYHLPEAVPGGDAMSFDGSVGSLARADAAKAKDAKARRSGASRSVRERFAPRLGDAHERVAFSRGLGVQMAATRAAHDADAAALASGAGAAFVVWPSRGTLPPYGEFRVVVTAVSDMPGEYFDALRCRVGDLPERTLPVRAGIVGSPLVVQPTKHAPMGYAAKGPRVKPVFGLDWGAVPVHSPATSKRFWCVNRGPADMEVEFTPWLNPAPDDPSAYFAGNADGVVCATTALVVDEIAGRVEVKVSGGGIMCARRGPFRVSPSGPVTIPGNGGRAGFEVEYDYHGAKPREFVGSVVSRQRLARKNGGSNGGSNGDSNDPKLRLELGCATTTASMDPGSPDRVDGLFRHAEEKPVRVRVTGGFHGDAAAPPVPMKPLVVRLHARAFTPRLTADEPANLLAYACDACADRSEASYFRSVTLTNENAEAIGFSLTCSDPFQIFDVEASTPQLGLGRETSLARSARAGIEPSEFKTIPWRVPAGENVHVTVRFAPPLPDEDDEGVVDRADYVAEGALVVLYDSDDVQHFPLRAAYRHPEVAADVAEVRLGPVHVRAPENASRRVVLTNDTPADAEWRAVVGGKNPGVFRVRPDRGSIPGKGENGRARSTTVEVSMAPRAEMPYEAEVTFETREGRGCVVAVKGEGTLREEKEGKVMPREPPVEP